MSIQFTFTMTCILSRDYVPRDCSETLPNTIYNLTQLFNNFWREHARGESSAEDCVEFVVQTTDAHLAEIPVRIDNGLTRLLAVGMYMC